MAKIENLATKLKVVRDNGTITFYKKLDLEENFTIEIRARNGDLEILDAGEVVETFDYASVSEPVSVDLEDLVDQINAFVTIVVSVVSKKIFIPANATTNDNNYAALSIASNGNDYFTFQTPNDFGILSAIKAVGIPTGGAAGAAKDIDLFSDYAKLGESATINTESNTTDVYDLTGTSGFITSIDLSTVFSNLEANHFCGVNIDHKTIGGAIDYLGIELEYIPQ